MKQKMRQVLFCLVMVLGIIGLAGCSSKKKTQIDAGVESQITSYVNQMMSQLESADDNTLTSAIKQYEDSDDATQVAFGTALQNWVDNKEIIGKISGDPADVKIKEGDNKGYDVKFKLTGEKRNASVSLGLSKKLELTSLSFNPVYSVMEKMEKAFMNLLMGMGTVFVILIFISWLISLFKYINVFEAKAKATKEVKVEQVEEVIVTESPVQESEPELSDDLELVAVITAAIAAYTGNSTDGLVVRSIKRVSKKEKIVIGGKISMKNYTITVNGNTYQVQVEEGEASSVSSPVTPLAKPTQAAPKAEVKASTGAAGSIKVESPMAGKILAVKANVGQSVKRGEVLLVLEAMKMENEIVAPEDGTVASINVAAGDAVETGQVLATLN